MNVGFFGTICSFFPSQPHGYKVHNTPLNTRSRTRWRARFSSRPRGGRGLRTRVVCFGWRAPRWCARLSSSAHARARRPHAMYFIPSAAQLSRTARHTGRQRASQPAICCPRLCGWRARWLQPNVRCCVLLYCCCRGGAGRCPVVRCRFRPFFIPSAVVVRRSPPRVRRRTPPSPGREGHRQLLRLQAEFVFSFYLLQNVCSLKTQFLTIKTAL